VESAQGLDAADRALRPAARRLIEPPALRDVLHGRWLGHAVHPLMTDFPLGLWTSGTVLDLVAGPEGRTAARRLIGLGVIAALPTAVTGLAEWAALDEQRDRRTGVVHAAVNVTALAAYTASWVARRRGRHGTGTALGLAGGVAATVGGFFGGHLTEARKISSRHPAFWGSADGEG
jgi:uncharacterized membrane protein